MDGQKYENSGQLVILFSPKTGLFHCLADRLQHQLLHDEIGVGVGVAAVVAEVCPPSGEKHDEQGFSHCGEFSGKVNGFFSSLINKQIRIL